MNEHPESLEQRLREDGAARRQDADAWSPDLADVQARSRRQRATQRKLVGTAAVIVAVLAVGAGAAVLRSGSAEQQLDVVNQPGPGATGPATTSPATTSPATTSPATTSPATTIVAPITTNETAPATKPSTTVPAVAVTLRGDGLGVATFGQDAASAEAALTAALGPPTSRPDWFHDGEITDRGISWGALTAWFRDDSGTQTFAGYAYGGGATPALRTRGELGLGATYGAFSASSAVAAHARGVEGGIAWCVPDNGGEVCAVVAAAVLGEDPPAADAAIDAFLAGYLPSR